MRTKFLSFLLLGMAALAGTTRAQEWSSASEAPKLDPKRIINRSMGFLKDREPELTAEEHALYEKATQMRETQPEFALKLLESIAVKNENGQPASPAFELLLGNVYYANGQIDKAEANYRKAVERYPSFLRAWTNLGVLHYAKREYAKAIPCLARAVELGNRESTTFGLMGLCLEHTGDAVGAELAFAQALAGDPGNIGWMDGLLRVFLPAKQYSRAEVMVRNLIKERPAEPKYWLIYANIMAATDRKLEAIALLEQAIATGVGGDEEFTTLAGLYADEQLISEAVQACRRIKVSAQALGEQHALQMVRIFSACAEWQKAEALLDDVGKLGVERPESLLQARADLLTAQKKWRAARTVLDELLKLNPMDGTALVSLGRAYAAEGDEVHATLAFEAAVQTKEGMHPASLALANIELKHRHYEQSVSYLEQALRVEKSEDIEEILTRVRSLVPNAEQKKT